MSKSTGNVVDPNLLIDCYGSDTLRFFVLREIPFGGDGDFGHQKLLTRYNTDLANDLDHLPNQCCSVSKVFDDQSLHLRQMEFLVRQRNEVYQNHNNL